MLSLRVALAPPLLTCLLLPLLLLPSGCATTSSVVMVDRIREGNGYALLVVHTDWELYEIGFERLQLYYTAESDGGRSGKIRTRRSGELELAELPAGEYRWREVRLGAHVVPLSRESGFSVREGAITYIGDIAAAYDPQTRRLVSLEVVDNEADVRARFREVNARLIEHYELDARLMTLEPVPALPGRP